MCPNFQTPHLPSKIHFTAGWHKFTVTESKLPIFAFYRSSLSQTARAKKVALSILSKVRGTELGKVNLEGGEGGGCYSTFFLEWKMEKRIQSMACQNRSWNSAQKYIKWFAFWSNSQNKSQPFKHQFHKMVKHTQKR